MIIIYEINRDTTQLLDTAKTLVIIKNLINFISNKVHEMSIYKSKRTFYME